MSELGRKAAWLLGNLQNTQEDTSYLVQYGGVLYLIHCELPYLV